MGTRLAFTINVPSQLRAHAFPPNLLISLVENAIKHGVEPSADGGTIDIGASVRDERLVVHVADTGRGVVDGENPADGHGVGLANVRERLAALYGSRARFSLAGIEPRGAAATLEIPYET